VAFRKQLTVLLILTLFLSVFAGGFHHCCDYYSHACSICLHGHNQPDLHLTLATAADNMQPLVAASRFVPSTETFPNPSIWRAPLSGRAPPLSF